ncbi:cytokine receptor-like factor 3 [Ixodes scapularis]
MNDLKGNLLTLREWQGSLKEVVQNLDYLEKQLLHSAHVAEEEVKCHFSQLEQDFIAAVRQRKNALLSEVAAARTKALKPVADCRRQIEAEITAADSAQAEGSQLLQRSRDKGQPNAEQTRLFCRRISDFESLPEIPTLLDVGTVAAAFDRGAVAQWTSGVLQYGTVLTACPVVVTHVEPRPGALRVHWMEPEEDSAEEHEYRLQHCVGDVLAEDCRRCSQFVEAYRGFECSFLVRGLPEGQPQSFRVACRTAIAKAWSAWSPLFVATTELEHYEWEERNLCYTRTHEGRIATRTSQGPSTVLFSKEPLLRSVNHNILFRFLDTPPDKWSKRDGVALVMGKPESLLSHGAVFVNMEGEIFVEGHRTTTQLPSLGKGSDATLDVEVVSERKVRVTVGCRDRQATYDLRVKNHDLDDTRVLSTLRFAAFFEEEGWKLLVE